MKTVTYCAMTMITNYVQAALVWSKNWKDIVQAITLTNRKSFST